MLSPVKIAEPVVRADQLSAPGYSLLEKAFVPETKLARRLTREANQTVYRVAAKKTFFGIAVPDHILEKVFPGKNHLGDIRRGRAQERRTNAPRVTKRKAESHETASHDYESTPDYFGQQVLVFFPEIPLDALAEILYYAFERGARVGLDFELPVETRVRLAVSAHIRHTRTDYDYLLDSGAETTTYAARSAVHKQVQAIMAGWKGVLAMPKLTSKSRQKNAIDALMAIYITDKDLRTEMPDATEGHIIDEAERMVPTPARPSVWPVPSAKVAICPLEKKQRQGKTRKKNQKKTMRRGRKHGMKIIRQRMRKLETRIWHWQKSVFEGLRADLLSRLSPKDRQSLLEGGATAMPPPHGEGRLAPPHESDVGSCEIDISSEGELAADEDNLDDCAMDISSGSGSP